MPVKKEEKGKVRGGDEDDYIASAACRSLSWTASSSSAVRVPD